MYVPGRQKYTRPTAINTFSNRQAPRIGKKVRRDGDGCTHITELKIQETENSAASSRTG